MKNSSKILSAIAASFLALAGVSKAQVVTVASDTSFYTGTEFTFNGTGSLYSSLGEAFTGVTSLESVTYTFIAPSQVSGSGGTLAASLVQWNGGSYTLVQSLGTLTIPDSSTWSSTLTYGSTTVYTYNANLDLSFTNTAPLNAADTYVVLLSNTSSSATGFGLGYVTQSLSGPGTADLAGGFYDNAAGTYLYAQPGNWTFSGISVVPSGNLPPTPEPATVAGIAGCVFAAGLVIYRLRQRSLVQPVLARAC